MRSRQGTRSARQAAMAKRDEQYNKQRRIFAPLEFFPHERLCQDCQQRQPWEDLCAECKALVVKEAKL